MNYIYVYPVDDFDRYADNETVIRAWQQGKAQRYTPEDFAELINNEMFCEVENWVRVIEEENEKQNTESNEKKQKYDKIEHSIKPNNNIVADLRQPLLCGLQ